MRALTGIILTLFLGLMFVSLFQMSGLVSVSHGMSGAGNCPSMADQEVVCAMSLSEHIGAWKDLFANLIPSAFLLLLSLGAAMLLPTIAPHLRGRRLLHLIPVHWQGVLRHRIYTYFVRVYQELFSRGILHPKLF